MTTQIRTRATDSPRHYRPTGVQTTGIFLRKKII